MIFRIGQQVRYNDFETSRGTVCAISGGSVRVTWRQPGRAQPRLRVWYDAGTAARFLKPS